VTLLQDVAEVLSRRTPGGVVLAHVAETPGKLGDPLAITGLALPLDRQVGGLQELGPGYQGDAWLAEDIHGESGVGSRESGVRSQE
jgi:hypothetical protein